MYNDALASLNTSSEILLVPLFLADANINPLLYMTTVYSSLLFLYLINDVMKQRIIIELMIVEAE
jgi:hypothetical protein